LTLPFSELPTSCWVFLIQYHYQVVPCPEVKSLIGGDHK
jgi:hypothetical protein